MRHYGHATWKRTKVWSTSCVIYRLSLGKLVSSQKTTTQSTIKYRDRKGLLRVKASKTLKETQPFDSFTQACLIDIPGPRDYMPRFCGRILQLRKDLLKSQPQVRKAGHSDGVSSTCDRQIWSHPW